ncbi:MULTISPECIES: amidohydrolase family protein [Rhodococcus]|uniref:Amidohydrolase n=1 Tax=Rhodococcus rhodochrous TaxID=1829 RepID=A0A6I6Y4B9_RHORH|nr:MULTISPECIES: amidohydrolase family protein [Rhodococcus]MBF4479273.1 amidohydrolase [Rhodococcus rhodochrous]MCB8913112.1 amidohydrolase [Rhodococcus rhodochrous]MCD2095881.1 amidohydrolase [Rhodococcus rhodochrous]MCD2109482.1 amidohydrolase [Rhodococcus rhodochrous]MCD2119685.1 amidohydrolase [Rhodococcus rhodochrous]
MYDLRDIKIIDTDTHVVEPPDLWTSRMSKKWGDLVPHVRWDEQRGDEAWFVSGTRMSAVGAPAMAGWHEYPPSCPPRFADTDPRSWDPAKRLALMDDYGIHAQILYPNVAVFSQKTLQSNGSNDLQLECVRAYNDYLTEWAQFAPGRYVPVGILPFWDMEATIAEVERVAAAGHKGLVFTQNPAAFGLPVLTDPYWDRLWASAQEKKLPINFHIASGEVDLSGFGHESNGVAANYGMMGISFFMDNARTISQLIFGGICDRFPELKFVSVESGIGWMPFALEGMDWQWRNSGVHKEHPNYELLPSEYFKRQIYGCFWFEQDSARSAIEQLGADNVLYETDYPHPTSMSPGPASDAVRPDDYLRRNFAHLSEADARKILHDNAAALYNLD